MKAGFELRAEQNQKLAMTPELRQAFVILQLPVLELADYIGEQVMENPLLELEESSRVPREIDWQQYAQAGREKEPGDFSAAGNEEEKERFPNFVAVAPTLADYLESQLGLLDSPEKISSLARYIIGNLDENGYLNFALEEMASELKCSLPELEAALAAVQGLDPAGVGARSLQECLRLQVDRLADCPPQMADFLNYLGDLAAGRMTKIAAALNVDLARVQEMKDIVCSLKPKPGGPFSGAENARYIVPDVMIEEVAGQYVVLVNDTDVPRLYINAAYRQALLEKEDDTARRYVEKKLNQAKWIIHSIEQRRMTLYKIAAALVRRQENFLRRGIDYLEPLTLKEIAEEIGVHESTVSRASAHKYVQSPQGLVEMKFFFARRLKESCSLSTEKIKRDIRELIGGEDVFAPYSDQKISDRLNERGIDISRRTVAKYREEMGILPAAARKRY